MKTTSTRSTLLSWLLVFVASGGTLCLETSSLTADMNVARSGHQASLLLDGRVLVTGGSNERGQAIGMAEIFDPATRTWSPATANLTPRLGHAASLLDDGRVLVVGGVPSTSACDPIMSAEVYDPSTDSWSVASNVPVPVGRGAVAVTLKDGRVLVAGGGTACGDVYRSAALFDTSTNTWSQAASMEAPSQFHVATRLGDGRVLVSGAGTAVYDPQTAVWAPLGDPRPLTDTPCEGDLRTYSPLLRRDFLIARATSDDCPSLTMLPADTLLVAGGVSTSNVAQSSVQLLDRRTGEDLRSWPMQVARVGHTRLKNGAVLIAGGRDGAARIASSEIYIPRLAHEASVIPTTRGGADEGPSYGRWLAAATNSRESLLISYKDGTRAPALLLEWGPEEWKRDHHTWNHKRGRRDHYTRSLGDDLPALNSIRIDERDNIWGVSSAAQEIFKISSDGEVLLRFGSPRSTDNNNAANAPRAQRARRHVESPSDVALDRNGNVFVSDAGERPRILKFDARGRFLAATGAKGSRPGDLDRPHSIATDVSGNVYVADSGNSRIQVFDNGLNFRAVYDTIGTPWAICVSKGSRQFLYSASNPDISDDERRSTAEIYKLELDGTILGKAVGEESTRGLSTPQHIHCRQANRIVGMGHFTFHEITLAR
jgi:hypothetical protein